MNTDQFTGDVTIARNLTMGGRLDVKGDAIIGKDLEVKGWVKGLNMIDVNKGVFASSAALSTAYPNPKAGWFAGVIGSGTPAITLYTVNSSGVWEEQTGKAYEINAPMWSEIDTINGDITTINGKIPAEASSSNKLADKAFVAGNYLTQDQVKALLGRSVGDAVRVTFRIPDAGSYELCASNDMLMMAVDGVGCTSNIYESSDDGEVTASFVFKDPTVIPDNAFSNDDGISSDVTIEKVRIPSFVRSIGEYSFKDAGASCVAEVECEGMTPPSTVDGKSPFEGWELGEGQSTLKVHKVAKDLYVDDPLWGTFETINDF